MKRLKLTLRNDEAKAILPYWTTACHTTAEETHTPLNHVVDRTLHLKRKLERMSRYFAFSDDPETTTFDYMNEADAVDVVELAAVVMNKLIQLALIGVRGRLNADLADRLRLHLDELDTLLGVSVADRLARLAR